MEQIDRITMMENHLDECLEAVRKMDEAIESYRNCLDGMKELSSYYQSEGWMKDHEDDENHMIPKDLKRGVLSEDGIWNLLSDHQRILEEMKGIIEEYGKV